MKNNILCSSFIVFLGSFFCTSINEVQAKQEKKEESKSELIGKNANIKIKTNHKTNFGVKGNIKEIEINSVNIISLSEKTENIFIPNPDVEDIEIINDTTLYLMGKTAGSTPIVIYGVTGEIIANYNIKVTYPIEEIKKSISETYPDSNVLISSLDKSIILKGTVPSPEVAGGVLEIIERFVDAKEIINKMTITTATQVLLKVKIAEVSRNVTRSIGIDWRALTSSSSTKGMTYGFLTGKGSGFPDLSALADVKSLHGALIGGAAAAAAAATGGGNAGAGGSDAPAGGTGDAAGAAAGGGGSSSAILGSDVTGGKWFLSSGTGEKKGLSSLIEALASEDFASILAEPTLVALSGKKATFKSGGEQGYTVSQSGSDSNTTEFKDWGTSIEFTPIVLSEGRINITVKPVVSTLKLVDANTPPSLETKEAETTVELGSGQSLAIAGLLQVTESSSSTETPFLADLPLIGGLFRSSAVTKNEKELIIIVTPYIVKPSSKKLITPVDMAPKMFSPFGSMMNRRFHNNIKYKIPGAGFSII